MHSKVQSQSVKPAAKKLSLQYLFLSFFNTFISQGLKAKLKVKRKTEVVTPRR